MGDDGGNRILPLDCILVKYLHPVAVMHRMEAISLVEMTSTSTQQLHTPDESHFLAPEVPLAPG